ncbi:alpha/beta-hydrolase [Macrolepiota fuliginosa MF-IS2]|uniref:Alpha/beta-hydrolase n=1 Tax=Macrolepiota fuliginosa MF-IS2 TaxID=1400762 RepID=A0A9P6C2F8_9AGAR|nr:alpha/beta-hydrolase [Macrolepiota fuliginosa MF-IS2]
MLQDGISYDIHQLFVSLPTGVSLEADLLKPNGLDENGCKLAICLHPWSWLGGQKDDPVLASLVDPLLERKYYVLRYNSRSVGKSTGFSSFTGFSEAEDLKALVQWALSQIENITSVVFIGYSHGSLISTLHPALPAPIRTSHVLLSYPLGPRGWLTLFRTSYYQDQLEGLLKDDRSNILAIFGDGDEFTSISSYKEWTEKLKEAVQGSDRLRIVEIENASHFWRGRSGLELGQVLRRWLP